MSIFDDVKARINIVELINERVALKREGTLHVACCPFHVEKTPSFKVSEERGRWQCYGACNEGGDIFDFIMKFDNLSAHDALETLAARAGVEIPTQQEADYSRLYEANVEASLWFHDNLRQRSGTPGREAFEYLRARGLEIETIKTWRLGYAPDQWTALREHLHAKGFADKELLDAGLLSETEKGNLIDFWRGRIMIPICDTQGRIIGFGGRAQEAECGKYINSRATAIFDKSQSLFGWYQGRKAAKTAGHVVLVEGYLDVLIAHQAGFANVVAPLGTAVAPSQIKTLAKSVARIVFAFDGDTAGNNAAEKTIRKMAAILRQSSQNMVDIRVLPLPDGKDPDDLIKASPEDWAARVSAATPADDYIIERATQVLPDSSIEREKLAIALAPVLHAIDRDIQRDFALQKLALRLGINERAILRLIAPSATVAEPATAPAPVQQMNQQERLLALLLQTPVNLALLIRQLNSRKLAVISEQDFHQPYRTIFKAWREALDQVEQDEYDYMWATLDPVVRDIYVGLLAVPPLPDFGFRLPVDSAVSIELRSMLYLILQIRRADLEQANRGLRASGDSFVKNLQQINLLIRFSRNL